MQINLHANATTTPKMRAYIQNSTASVAQLAAELGVHEKTVRRWRSRKTTEDRSSRPKTVRTSFTPVEEELICELRTRLELPLDDIVEVMKRCMNPDLSRSSIHRCLQRHKISQRSKPKKPVVQPFEETGIGFIHMDLKYLPALEKRKTYVFVAIDRATRYVYAEIQNRRDAKTAAAFLERFMAHFPAKVHTILTDNGAEFTDRFGASRWLPPEQRKPTGRHIFDRVCTRHGIEHRLTKPFSPQTNGMVERFNRRIDEAVAREPKRGTDRRLFRNNEERNRFVARFINDYNHTRLKCLGYQAPMQMLANLAGPYTFAGISDCGLCAKSMAI